MSAARSSRVNCQSNEATPFDCLTFHDLRHTCASLMIAAANQAGAGQAVTIKSIAEQLGHMDGGVLVLRRYGHLFKGTRRHAALALTDTSELASAAARSSQPPKRGRRHHPVSGRRHLCGTCVVESEAAGVQCPQKSLLIGNGSDGTRTRDLRRDRPAF